MLFKLVFYHLESFRIIPLVHHPWALTAWPKRRWGPCSFERSSPQCAQRKRFGSRRELRERSRSCWALCDRRETSWKKWFHHPAGHRDLGRAPRTPWRHYLTASASEHPPVLKRVDPDGEQVGVLPGPQTRIQRFAGGLHRAERGHRACRPERVRGVRAETEVSAIGQGVAWCVGSVRAVSAVPAGSPQGALHHELHRIAECWTAQSHP